MSAARKRRSHAGRCPTAGFQPPREPVSSVDGNARRHPWGTKYVTNQTTEIAIVGGGVIGASIAWQLARRGANVTLIERDRLAAGASAGGVRQLGRDPREMPLAIASIARWQTLEAELEANVEFRTGGQLRVAKREQDAPLLRQQAAEHRALGLDIRFVEGLELRRIAPDLAPGIE